MPEPELLETVKLSDGCSLSYASFGDPAGKPVFQIKKDVTTIDIKEGDALLYIKFNTTEKIKLIEFDDSEFQRLAERSPEYMCGTLKDHDDNIISLKKCYDYFNRFKMKRRIMKLIKRNLI